MNSLEWYNTGRTETINSLDVFVKRSGKGEALICIHGFPSSSWDFEAVWPALTERFDVIAHDLIGLGKSAKPSRPLSISLQADVVEGLAAREGITKAHILAHDLGDTVAQELLARQHEGTAKIKWLSCVFLNGGLFPETHRPLLVQKLLLSPLGPLVAKLMSEMSLKKSFTGIFSKAHPPTEEFVQETWKLASGNNGITMMPRLIRYIEERKVNRERWVRPMVEAAVPVRLINGVEDPISGAHLADRFEELIPDADVVRIKNSGHYPHVETPEEVLEAFFAFFELLRKKPV